MIGLPTEPYLIMMLAFADLYVEVQADFVQDSPREIKVTLREYFAHMLHESSARSTVLVTSLTAIRPAHNFLKPMCASKKVCRSVLHA